MEVFILRMVERLLAVLIGGLLVYLGYMLFKIVPYADSGEGTFKFPGGSVHLFRTGPGVFFALFGCVVLYLSYTNPISATDSASGTTTVYGLSENELAKAQIWIQDLNELESTMIKDHKDTYSIKYAPLFRQLKLYIIRNMQMDPNSEEFKEFEKLIRMGTQSDFGDKWQKWADIYYGK